MITRLKLKPGQHGTKALVEKYGDALVCVRYRYDAEGTIRLKTVELVEEKKELKPPRQKIADDARSARVVIDGICSSLDAKRDLVRLLSAALPAESLLLTACFLPGDQLRQTARDLIDGCELPGSVVRDVYTELIFQGKEQVQAVKRVNVQCGEGALGRDALEWNSLVIRDHLDYTLRDVVLHVSAPGLDSCAQPRGYPHPPYRSSPPQQKEFRTEARPHGRHQAV